MALRKTITSSFLFLLTCNILSADQKGLFLIEEPEANPKAPGGKEELILPWLTGPLLAGSAHTVPVGHWNFEPYLFANTAFGSYDRHWKSHNAPHNFYNINALSLVQVGIAPRLDFTVIPQFSYNHIKGASHWVINDLPLQLGIQIVNDIPAQSWYPAIKLNLSASAPIGKYDKLENNGQGTDAGGSGSWRPGVALNFSKLYHYSGAHFLAARLDFAYTIPNSVHVKGLNVYGGGKGTHGTVYPGPVLTTDIGLEYTLTQNWALALDIVYTHANHTRFAGHKGSVDGVPNSIGAPSSESVSLAPAFEYNWSPNCGLIAGVWFSVAGRNSSDFANGVVAVNIYR